MNPIPAHTNMPRKMHFIFRRLVEMEKWLILKTET